MQRNESSYDNLDTSILDNYYHHRKRKEKKGLYNFIEDEERHIITVPDTNIKFSILYSSKMTHQEFLDKNYLKIDVNNISAYKEIVKENEINIEVQQADINYLQSTTHIKCIKAIKSIAKLVGSGMIGVGSALAMMPVVNYNVKQLEEFDIEVHEKEAFFITSTLNTLVILSICNSLGTYKYLSHKQAISKEPHIQLDHEPTRLDFFKQMISKLGGAASVMVTLQPLFLLWVIERTNKQISNDDIDFDEFTAWATFTSVPLVLYKLLENYGNYTKTIESYKTRDIEIDSFGAKAFINSTTALSMVGRGIALTNVYDKLLQQTGMDEDVSMALSIVLGGVVTNVAQATLEYGHIQSLFEKQIEPVTCKNKMLGFFSTIEAAWFSLPIVAQGLNAVESLNSLIKMLIFLPTFISRMLYEMHNIYDVFQPAEEINTIQHVDLQNDKTKNLLGDTSGFQINEIE